MCRTVCAFCLQGPEAVKQTVLSAWAAYLGCPEVATQAINFAAIDWPAEQASTGHKAGGQLAGCGGTAGGTCAPGWAGM